MPEKLKGIVQTVYHNSVEPGYNVLKGTEYFVSL
jgi:hypothetical protein